MIPKHIANAVKKNLTKPKNKSKQNYLYKKQQDHDSHELVLTKVQMLYKQNEILWTIKRIEDTKSGNFRKSSPITY